MEKSILVDKSCLNSFYLYLEKNNVRNSVKLRETRYFGYPIKTKAEFVRRFQLSANSHYYKSIVRNKCLYKS